MAQRFHPLAIDPNLITNVGLIAIQWARIEFTLQKMVVGILDAHAPTGLLLSANVGFRALQDFISCYVQSNPPQGPDFASDLEALIGEAQRLYAIRNKFVHQSWHPENGKDELLVLRFRGKIQIYSERWSETQIATAAQETVELLTALTELADAYALFDRFEEWEQQTPLSETIAPLRLAQPPVRDPKTIEVISRLKSESN